MKKLSVFLIVFFLAFPLIFSQEYCHEWECNFPYQGSANDYHYKGYVVTEGGELPRIVDHFETDKFGDSIWELVSYSITHDPLDPGKCQFVLDYLTSDRITAGDVIRFGVKFAGAALHSTYVLDSYWTNDNQKVESSIKEVGNEIYRDSQGKLMARLKNDFNISLEVKTLQFGITEDEVPLPDMSPTGLGNPGEVGNPIYDYIDWKDYPQNIILGPGGCIEIDLDALGVVLIQDEYLQIRAYNENQNTAWWGQTDGPY